MGTPVPRNEVVVLGGDITAADLASARESGVVAVDFETGGLDWMKDPIATCQLRVGRRTLIVRVAPGALPTNIVDVLDDGAIRKVFHHAPFDLRFAMHQWGATPRAVTCTKVLARIAYPQHPNPYYGLAALASRVLNVTIAKDEQTSDWLAPSLSPSQLAYAARDVEYLIPLADALWAAVAAAGREELAIAAEEFLIPAVRLQMEGVASLFEH